MTKLHAIFMFAVVLMSSTIGRSHGTEKPGPNGGELRMPGDFHTEVKQRGREFEVFLLDNDFKNPQTTDSVVDIQVIKPDTAAPIEVACRSTRAARPPHFVCMNPKYKPVNGDILKLKAKRGDAIGAEVEYKLPLLQPVVAKSVKSSTKTDAKKPASAHDVGHGQDDKSNLKPQGNPASAPSFNDPHSDSHSGH